ncbi:adenylylsulfate kinase [Pedobacter psychrotolerans]|uniref:Adenylyl-sulfate kinase n=1 Tax=Pedobacter psychrotolerans TaxID=1843235 RepID=A0A4R2H7U3_9SPHI|nr:adenylyl-sulfate kinase [Pedobacter psychrotolerans]TCO21434.1 adenylylsulfate kinase [Pedobacter psychrotolerans]GGE38628.1 adenylyl-sulfate kinase [Pedobacter psychrotolerans]
MALILQFTGMSGAGKTSISEAFKASYPNKKIMILDGDLYRKTLCADLGFTKTDRIENVRRLGQLASTLSRDYDVIIIAVINPYEEGRAVLKETCSAELVYIYCSLDILLRRDTKGLYKRALLLNGDPGKLDNLTGVNDIFEEPKNVALTIDTSNAGLEESVTKLTSFVTNTFK